MRGAFLFCLRCTGVFSAGQLPRNRRCWEAGRSMHQAAGSRRAAAKERYHPASATRMKASGTWMSRSRLPDGTYSHGVTTFALDGTPSPASGNPEADLALRRGCRPRAC